MDVYQGIAVASASLGGFDKTVAHEPQTLPHETYSWKDDNFPPRDKSMSPRLQSKIPKCFAWQLAPNHETYLWLDGNIKLTRPDSLQHFVDELGDNDFLVLRHPTRPNIRQEVRYTRKGIKQESLYMLGRYPNELLAEMYKIVENDKDYVDDLLAIGGVFMYRNTPAVQNAMKEWWYYISRYIVQDQLSFAYVLKKSGIKLKVIDEDFNNSPFIKLVRHNYRDH